MSKYSAVAAEQLAKDIFRAYDIRGIVGETLTVETVYSLGLAIGTEASRLAQSSILVGRDARLSGPELSKALQAGLLETGLTVIDIGVVPTPVLYFATHVLTTNSGVMLTGSHNPANYNGLKIVLGGNTLAEGQIQQLYQRIVEQAWVKRGTGTLVEIDVIPRYLAQIVDNVHIAKPLKVVVDCGNGVTGKVAPQLLHCLGCDVVPLYCQLDGRFPNHHPDPSKLANLHDLIATVRAMNADVGLAFDGDGDRLGVVSSDGSVIWPDRQMILFARDLLQRNPGATILFDVKCSRHLPCAIQKEGGRPIMGKTGHSLIKAKMQAEKALLAGEMSGHIFFKERWFGFDDALYAAARLLEILAKDSRTPAEIFRHLPDSVNTPEIQVPIPEDEKFAFVEQFIAKAHFPEAQLHTIDGLRVDFADGWGLVRASNTSPSLVFRFEADSSEGLERIQRQFKQQLWAVNPHLELAF